MSCGSCGPCGPCGSCGGCKAIKMIVALLMTLLAVAAIIGVYKAHMTIEGWDFGSTDASVALIASVLALKIWLKLVRSLCPCRKWVCGPDSKCCGCGTDPCSCK